MNRPLGMHLSFARTASLPERLRVLKDAGFDSTALWWEERRPEIRAIRDRVPEIVRVAGLEIDHLHAPYFACNELSSTDANERRAAFDLHRGWVADCARHGIPRLVMHVTRGRSVPLPDAGAVDDFRRLVDFAEADGVTLAIENTHAPSHLHLLFEHIDSPALRLCYDVAHDRLHSDAPLTLLRRWRDRLAVMHVSDTDGRRDWHWLPGDGNTDFEAVGSCFNQAYAGPLMLESMLREDEPAREFACRAYAAAVRVREALHSGCANATVVR
jgi:sugar phosphate isomerase/epimerase